jgi:hypothetical protein
MSDIERRPHFQEVPGLVQKYMAEMKQQDLWDIGVQRGAPFFL